VLLQLICKKLRGAAGAKSIAARSSFQANKERVVDRKWIAGIVVAVIVVLALVAFSQNRNQPDATAADPTLTGPSDPAPRP
jgi:hypothetical protein